MLLVYGGGPADGSSFLGKTQELPRESDADEFESRKACPELVERGRLNLAQDTVPSKSGNILSPAWTAESQKFFQPSLRDYPDLCTSTQDYVLG